MNESQGQRVSLTSWISWVSSYPISTQSPQPEVNWMIWVYSSYWRAHQPTANVVSLTRRHFRKSTCVSNRWLVLEERKSCLKETLKGWLMPHKAVSDVYLCNSMWFSMWFICARFDGGGKGQLIISISKLIPQLSSPRVFPWCSPLLLSFSFTHLWRVWLPLWRDTEWDWSEEITFKSIQTEGGTFPRNPARGRGPLAGRRTSAMPALSA